MKVNMDEVKLSLKDINKNFGNSRRSTEVLDNVSLDIKKGELLCVVGPSGCGKTTLINLILGLDRPTSGEILIDGVPINGVGTDRACVFQENTLFPWLSVRGNVELGLKVKKHRMKGVTRAQRREMADRYIDEVGLAQYAEYRVHELSGGMKQRASLARALVLETEILLMDEPFGALDIATKKNMQAEILKIWQNTGKTIIFVTHDVDEAVMLAQRVVVLGKAPCSVKEIVEISNAYPRDAQSPEIRSVVSSIKEKISFAHEAVEV